MRALTRGVARMSLMLGRFSQLSVSMRSMRSRSSLLRVAGGGGYCPLMICTAGRTTHQVEHPRWRRLHGAALAASGLRGVMGGRARGRAWRRAMHTTRTFWMSALMFGASKAWRPQASSYSTQPSDQMSDCGHAAWAPAVHASTLVVEAVVHDCLRRHGSASTAWALHLLVVPLVLADLWAQAARARSEQRAGGVNASSQARRGRSRAAHAGIAPPVQLASTPPPPHNGRARTSRACPRRWRPGAAWTPAPWRRQSPRA